MQQTKKVLLNKDISQENKLKDLLAFSSKPTHAVDRKTKMTRVLTAKIKESKGQDEICSPQKKKKESSCASGKNESPKNKRKKKERMNQLLQEKQRKKAGNSFIIHR